MTGTPAKPVSKAARRAADQAILCSGPLANPFASARLYGSVLAPDPKGLSVCTISVPVGLSPKGRSEATALGSKECAESSSAYRVDVTSTLEGLTSYQESSLSLAEVTKSGKRRQSER